MQPHDSSRSHGEFPDDISRTEQSHAVSTDFAPGTEGQIRRAVKIAIVVLFVGFLIVSALKFLHARSVARSGELAYTGTPPVDVVVARPVSQGEGLVLPGETAAWYESTLYARVNGYVGTWYADIGDHVTKGQVLASIETPELDAELAAARAEVKAAAAQVEARRAEMEFAKTTNERWRDSPRGVVSEQERESKKADYESAQARLAEAEAQRALDQSKVDQYTALTQFKQVRAPFAGTITQRRIDVGNLVTAGSATTTTPLYRMAQTDPLRIFVDVPQSAAGDLMRPGVAAQIRAAGAGGGGVFSGTVARAAEALNPDARTMRVEVDVPNANHVLVPGMYVTVAFSLPPHGRVVVPAAALIFRASGAEVAKVDSHDRVQFEHVTIGRDDGSTVQLASGVAPGDRLVLNISSQIAPNEKVLVQAPSPGGAAEAATPSALPDAPATPVRAAPTHAVSPPPGAASAPSPLAAPGGR